MHRPAAVEIAYECMRFLITHNPTNATLNRFTEVLLAPAPLRRLAPDPPCPTHSATLRVFQDLKRFHVNTLVRVCEATYDKAPVEKEGIQVVVSRPRPQLLIGCFLF